LVFADYDKIGNFMKIYAKMDPTSSQKRKKMEDGSWKIRSESNRKSKSAENRTRKLEK